MENDAVYFRNIKVATSDEVIRYIIPNGNSKIYYKVKRDLLIRKNLLNILYFFYVNYGATDETTDNEFYEMAYCFINNIDWYCNRLQIIFKNIKIVWNLEINK